MKSYDLGNMTKKLQERGLLSNFKLKLEYVTFKKNCFHRYFGAEGHKRVLDLVQDKSASLSFNEVCVLNDSLVLTLLNSDSLDKSNISVSQGYGILDGTDDESKIEESFKYLLDLISIKGDLAELNKMYEMDFNLLVHFIKVDRILNRLTSGNYRRKVLEEVGVPNLNIFKFDKLNIDGDYLENESGLDEKYKSEIKKHYNITKLSSGRVFTTDITLPKTDIMYTDYEDKNQATLYKYYTKVVKTFVSFCMKIICYSYNKSSVYTVKKIEDVESELGTKLNLGVGELDSGITSTKLTSYMNTLCNDIYSREHKFNKMSMLGLVYLVSSLLSKENVSLEVIKRGLF